MARPPFQCKRFRVEQDAGVHPVGTDGLMLGTWPDVSGLGSVLDIGTGTGLLALLLAQRTEHLGAAVRIHAVESSPEACRYAHQNFAASPWPTRLTLSEQRVQDFAQTHPGGFDLVVSNPPFFSETVLSPDPSRRQSRNAAALPLSDLLAVADALLAPGGRFCAIMPPKASQQAFEQGALRGLYCTRMTVVHSRPGKPVERVLFQLERNPYPFERSVLTVQDEGGRYTDGYRRLIVDVLLPF